MKKLLSKGLILVLFSVLVTPIFTTNSAFAITPTTTNIYGTLNPDDPTNISICIDALVPETNVENYVIVYKQDAPIKVSSAATGIDKGQDITTFSITPGDKKLGTSLNTDGSIKQYCNGFTGLKNNTTYYFLVAISTQDSAVINYYDPAQKQISVKTGATSATVNNSDEDFEEVGDVTDDGVLSFNKMNVYKKLLRNKKTKQIGMMLSLYTKFSGTATNVTEDTNLYLACNATDGNGAMIYENKQEIIFKNSPVKNGVISKQYFFPIELKVLNSLNKVKNEIDCGIKNAQGAGVNQVIGGYQDYEGDYPIEFSGDFAADWAHYHIYYKKGKFEIKVENSPM